MKKKWLVFLTACIVFLTVSCQQEGASSTENKIDADVPFIIEGELPSSPPAQEWIADAVVDIAEKLNVDTDTVSYIGFDLPVWPDTSYGCPQPEQEYLQEPREGYQIHLQIDGTDYFYHGGEEIEQFLCENN